MLDSESIIVSTNSSVDARQEQHQQRAGGQGRCVGVQLASMMSQANGTKQSNDKQQASDG